MYPAGGVATFRTPKGTKDVVLGGGRLVVPPGVGLHMPITAVHHSKDLWEEPEVFKPERFFEVCVPLWLKSASLTVTTDQLFLAILALVDLASEKLCYFCLLLCCCTECVCEEKGSS